MLKLAPKEIEPVDKDEGEIGRFTILNQAALAVSRNEDVYGVPKECFEQIAARWSLTFGIPIPAYKVGAAMIDLKLVRLLVNPKHIDNCIDIAGYASCTGEVALAETSDD